MVSDIKNQAGVTTGKGAERVDVAAFFALFQSLAVNIDREPSLVQVPSSVLEAMALGMQRLTVERDLFSWQNTDLRGQLVKTQQALAAVTSAGNETVTKSNNYKGVRDATDTAAKIEAGADKLGLYDRQVSHSAISETIDITVTGPARDISKLMAWTAHWINGGSDTTLP